MSQVGSDARILSRDISKCVGMDIVTPRFKMFFKNVPELLTGFLQFALINRIHRLHFCNFLNVALDLFLGRFNSFYLGQGEGSTILLQLLQLCLIRCIQFFVFRSEFDAMLIGIVYGISLGVILQIGFDVSHGLIESLVFLLLLTVPFLSGNLCSQDVLKAFWVDLVHIALRSCLFSDAVIGVEVFQQLVVVRLTGEVIELRSQLCGVGLTLNGDSMLGSICTPVLICLGCSSCITQFLQNLIELEARSQLAGLSLIQIQRNLLAVAVIDLLDRGVLEHRVVLVIGSTHQVCKDRIHTGAVVWNDHSDSGIVQHHANLDVRNTDGNGADIGRVPGIVLQVHGILEVDALHIGLAAGGLKSVLISPDQLQLTVCIPGKTCKFLAKASVDIRDQRHIDLDAGQTEELDHRNFLGIGMHRELSGSQVCYDLAVVEPVLHNEVGEGLHSGTADGVQIFSQAAVLAGDLSILRQIVVVGIELLHELGAVAAISGFNHGEQIRVITSQAGKAIRSDEILDGQGSSQRRNLIQQHTHSLYCATLTQVQVALIILRSAGLQLTDDLHDFVRGQLRLSLAETKCLRIGIALLHLCIPFLADCLRPLLDAQSSGLNEAAKTRGLKAILTQDLVDLCNSQCIHSCLLDEASLTESVDHSLICLSLFAHHQQVDVHRVVTVGYQSGQHRMAILQVRSQCCLIDSALLRECHFAVSIHLVGNAFDQALLLIHDGQCSFDFLLGIAFSQESGLQSLSAAVIPSNQVEYFLGTILAVGHGEFAMFIGLNYGTLAEGILDCGQILTGINGHIHIHISQDLLHAHIELCKFLGCQRVRINTLEDASQLVHEFLNPALQVFQEALVLLGLCAELSQFLTGIGVQQHSLAGITYNFLKCLLLGHLDIELLSCSQLLGDHIFHAGTLFAILFHEEIRKCLVLSRRTLLSSVNQLMAKSECHHGLSALVGSIQIQIDLIGLRIVIAMLSSLAGIYTDINLGSLCNLVSQFIRSPLGFVQRQSGDTIFKDSSVTFVAILRFRSFGSLSQFIHGCLLLGHLLACNPLALAVHIFLLTRIEFGCKNTI